MFNNDEPVLDENINHQNYDPQIETNIRKMLQSQQFSILCTQGDEQPYGSLVAFAYSDDLKHFFFTTPTATRKYMLLSKCSHVALVIDTRSEHPDSMKNIEAITITGIAQEVKPGSDYEKGMKLLKGRHPYMVEFLEAKSTAMFQIDTIRYFHVSRFQEVSQWIP